MKRAERWAAPESDHISSGDRPAYPSDDRQK